MLKTHNFLKFGGLGTQLTGLLVLKHIFFPSFGHQEEKACWHEWRKSSNRTKDAHRRRLILKRGFLSRQTMNIAGVIYTNRSVILTAGASTARHAVAMFFLYVLIVGVVFLNVVVTVLLDKFLRSIQSHQDEQGEKRK